MYSSPSARRPFGASNSNGYNSSSPSPFDDGGDGNGGSDRILDLVNQKDVLGSEGTGTLSVNQMRNVFQLFEPDEDNTISAESQ